MKHRFLLHSLSHTFLVVEITELSAQNQTVPFVRFQNWTDAEQYFLAMGATPESVAETLAWLQRCSTAVLTIV